MATKDEITNIFRALHRVDPGAALRFAESMASTGSGTHHSAPAGGLQGDELKEYHRMMGKAEKEPSGPRITSDGTLRISGTAWEWMAEERVASRGSR